MHTVSRKHAVTCSSVTSDRSLTFSYPNLGNFRGFYSQKGKSHKKSITVGTPMAPPLINGRLSYKLENVTPDLLPCHTQVHQTTRKLQFWGKFAPLMENFQNSSILRVVEDTD